MSEPVTIQEAFQRAVERWPDRVFVHALGSDGVPDQRITYRAADARIGALAAGFGTPAGARILCYDDDIATTGLVFLAAVRIHAAACYVSPLRPVSMVQMLAAELACDLVVCEPERVEEIRALGLAAWSAPELEHRGAERPRDGGDLGDARDLAHFQPSAGTTGPPKIVARDHLPFMRAAVHLSFGMEAEAEPPQRILVHNTLCGNLGVYVLQAALRLGATLCVPARRERDAVRATSIRALRPTYVVLSPNEVRAVCTEDATAPLGPEARLLYLGPAGGHLTRELDVLERLQSSGVDVLSGYGSSEVSALCTLTPRGAWTRADDCGVFLPDVRYCLDTDGELLVQSGGLMRGYVGDRATSTNPFTADGFFRTRDYVHVGEDRRLRLLGRVDDAFRLRDGTLVHPAALEEQILSLHDWIAQAVLVGAGRDVATLLVTLCELPADAPAGAFLDEAAHADAYERARTALRVVQARLPVRTACRIALLARPIPVSWIRPTLIPYKVSVDRDQIASAYAAALDGLGTTT